MTVAHASRGGFQFSKAGPRTWAERFILLGILAACVVGVAITPVSSTGSDSYGMLLVSEKIATSGDIRLDADRDYFVMPGGQLHHSITEYGGHIYHFFPIGTPLIFAPVMALTHAAGLKARDIDRPMQKLLAGVTSAIAIWIVFSLVRPFAGFATALAMGCLAFFGTIVSATLGSALWSINLEVVCAGLAALYLSRLELYRRPPVSPVLFGFLLFLGFLVRPTMAPVIALILIYLWMRWRGSFWKAALTSATLLAGFMVWSWANFGHPLPPYYSPDRLSLAIVPTALYGAFFSASRNILIWAPLLIVFPLLMWWRRKSLSPLPLLLTFAALTSLAPIFAFPHWWMGHSYGPRAATTAIYLFSLAAITLIWQPEVSRANVSRARWALIISLLLGLFVNLPGLIDPSTEFWNAYPDVDRYPDKVLYDWRFPQFLSYASTLKMKYDVQSAELGLPVDQMLPVRGLAIVGADARVTRPLDIPSAMKSGLIVKIVVVQLGGGSYRVLMNGSPVGTVSGGKVASAELVIPAELEKPGMPNILIIAGSKSGIALISYVIRT